MRCLALFIVSIGFIVGCGSTGRSNADCTGADCNAGTCDVGASRACYTGNASTDGVGECRGGTQSCTPAATWGACQGEVTPAPENCTDGIDNNCNGEVDEMGDADGDGFATCGSTGQPLDCCDDPSTCSNPAEVNPGAYDTPGDGVDNDCNGSVDDTYAACDSGLASGSTDPLDFAKAIDLCQTATATDHNWGVIDAMFTLADGTGVPNDRAHAILSRYGTAVTPHAGQALMLISTGNAAGMGDANFNPMLNADMGKTSAFPADFVSANGGTLPNAPGCPPPPPFASSAGDPIMLRLRVRVPTNARSFSIDTNFFSDEYPEWTCSLFNDFFVVLLDSAYSGAPANPIDKNLAFYTDAAMKKFPVGVNLASGNTGLFTQCVNGALGCSVGMGTGGMISTCSSTADLAGTGMDRAAPNLCNANSTMGGGTGWLTTTGNVNPGETITLRIAIWDTTDSNLDSLAVIDNFKWSADPSTPGTVILRSKPSLPPLSSPVRLPE